MNYKAYPNELWKQIELTLQQLKSQPKNQPLIAAFDADGTLWDIDLGENFFQYQIEQKQIPLPQAPWNHYLEMKKINNDPRSAYVWLAQINKGYSLEQVQKWALEAFNQAHPVPFFQEQKKLIQYFLQEGVEVYIVTASVKWAIEPAAAALGISADHVVGVETMVQSGVITDEPIYPITYRQGKSEALLKQTQQKQPFFCSGNTMGDLELLQMASHLRLAVSASSRDDKLFRTESELQQTAQQNKWLNHRFI